jgi:nucleoside-diphosphate-sugar epimerase
MNEPKVLITGAAGRLGSAVASLFHAEGYELVATDLVDAHDAPYLFRVADLLDHRAVTELLDGIDIILHIGNRPGIGLTPPQVVFSENITMNENVFQGAAEHGVSTIVFASTLQLIGSHVDERTVVTPPRRPTYPLSGATPPDPSNVYALSKTVSETMLRYYAERCGLSGTALRFPMLHRNQDRVLVGSGEETEIDILEGFTGLTYDDAAWLFLAVVRAELSGYHVFMAGTAHRHRDLTLPDLVRIYYPGVPDDVADLIDDRPLFEATGWRPTGHYHRAAATTDSTEDLQP